MATKYQRAIVPFWIFILVATLDTVSHGCAQGLRTLDKNKFGPKPKGTIMTIEVPEYGDLIDCVDIYKQPAFDHPLIKNIQMEPSSNLIRFNKTNNLPKLIQNWHKYGKCPKGTIPIRRTWKNNGTIHRKTPNDDPSLHEYASAVQRGGIYHGATAALNVWNPHVVAHEFSLSQVWVISGLHSPTTSLNSIEAGWIVYPSHYPDSQTRLFTYWTRNNYQGTGCYDVECPGFMQTTHDYALGEPIMPVSVYGGQAKSISVSLSRDRVTGHWWLQVENIVFGYFPREIFTTLGDGAETVSFGGEIVNTRNGHRHTTTWMGSGHFPIQGYGKASYVRNIAVVNNAYAIVDADLTKDVTRPTCYDLIMGRRGTTYKSHFYFGGPGYSPQCK